MPNRCDVAVIGAGLAGLACALPLARGGLDVAVLESSDDVGGRVRTDRVDGFLLDRGFQVLSTGYPEARRVLDFGRLELRRFDRAMLLQIDGEQVRLADPLREPGTLPPAATAPFGTVRDKLALTAYAAFASAAPVGALKARRDVSALQTWRRHGLSDDVIDSVLRPFFAGVLLEDDMDSSGRFVNLMTRMFVRGNSALPARGMQSIAHQLVAGLSPDSVHIGVGAQGVTHAGVETSRGPLAARAVVVATEADSAHALLPGLVGLRPWKGVSTVYHAAPWPPTENATLLVDAERSPVNNTVVLTAAAPTYSSDGRALIATSVVHGAAGGGAVEAGEPEIRRRLADLYRTSTRQWEHVATYDIPRALPSMVAPHPFRRPVRLVRGGSVVYLCGDHRDTSSIQGALVSGRRAAEAVLGDFGRPSKSYSGSAA